MRRRPKVLKYKVRAMHPLGNGWQQQMDCYDIEAFVPQDVARAIEDAKNALSKIWPGCLIDVRRD